MVRCETCSFSARLRAVCRRPPRSNCTMRNSRSARRIPAILSGGVQADAVSFRVVNLGDPSDVGDVVLRLDDFAAGFLDAGEHLVDAAVAVEVDHGAVGAGAMAFSNGDGAGDAGPLVGEDGQVREITEVEQRARENGFVEANGAAEVGGGNLEPGDGGGDGLFGGGHWSVLSFKKFDYESSVGQCC